MTDTTLHPLIAQAAPAETNPWSSSSDAAAAAPSPWDTAATPTTDAFAPAGTDAWGTATASPDPAAASGWLGAPDPLAGQTDAAGHPTGFALHQLWDGSLPIETWINHGLAWVVQNFRPFFQTVRVPIDGTLSWVEGLLTSVPSLAMIALMARGHGHTLVGAHFAGVLHRDWPAAGNLSRLQRPGAACDAAFP